MSAQRDGGWAFARPYFESASGEWSSGHSGMTLRDYFAGQALIGLLAGRDTSKKVVSQQDYALSSYSAADAMLAAREVRS